MANSSSAIACPVCKTTGSSVTDCRPNEAGIRRRRRCKNNHRFTTQEISLTEWQTQIEEAIDEVMSAIYRTAEQARDSYRNKNRG